MKRNTSLTRTFSVALFAGLLVPIAIVSQTSRQRSAQREVVAAERAFARYCVENGIRAAWLEFFTDDGIIFQPGPTNSKEFYSKRPVQIKPLRIVLNWEPRYGDVSQSGDLAYNVGPWNLDINGPEKQPTEHGYYMSIWRKQPDGNWKVALDFGSGTGAPATEDHVFGKPFQPASQYKSKVPRGVSSAIELQSLMQIDRGVQDTAQSTGALNAYLGLIAAEAKIMRAALAPAARESIQNFIPAGKSSMASFIPMGGEVASSGDLGYTYGRYELQENEQIKEKGYYAHVFKRNRSGEWKIVVSNTEKVEKE